MCTDPLSSPPGRWEDHRGSTHYFPSLLPRAVAPNREPAEGRLEGEVQSAAQLMSPLEPLGRLSESGADTVACRLEYGEGRLLSLFSGSTAPPIAGAWPMDMCPFQLLRPFPLQHAAEMVPFPGMHTPLLAERRVRRRGVASAGHLGAAYLLRMDSAHVPAPAARTAVPPGRQAVCVVSPTGLQATTPPAGCSSWSLGSHRPHEVIPAPGRIAAFGARRGGRGTSPGRREGRRRPAADGRFPCGFGVNFLRTLSQRESHWIVDGERRARGTPCA